MTNFTDLEKKRFLEAFEQIAKSAEVATNVLAAFAYPARVPAAASRVHSSMQTERGQPVWCGKLVDEMERDELIEALNIACNYRGPQGRGGIVGVPNSPDTLDTERR